MLTFGINSYRYTSIDNIADISVPKISHFKQKDSQIQISHHKFSSNEKNTIFRLK